MCNGKQPDDHDAMTAGEPDHDVVALAAGEPPKPENIWRPWECDDPWADEALDSYSCYHRELVSDELREHRATIKELRERDPERYEELRALSDAEGEGDDWLDEIAIQAAGPDCICIVGEGMGAEVRLTAEASARIDHAVADVLWCLRDQRPAAGGRCVYAHGDDLDAGSDSTSPPGRRPAALQSPPSDSQLGALGRQRRLRRRR